jgi:AcrR family transcriptional regulator
MARSGIPTRERIISAASTLFYNDGIRGVSVDAVAAKAGVTKRTLYYHFKSKDDLVAAYLAARDQPNLALFRQWFAEADDGLPAQVERIFRNLARSARHPKWKGCGFLRTSAELANMPGHPAMKIGAAHKKKFEEWLRSTFAAAGITQAAQLARQILLLLDGSFAVVLLHRDPSYMETAGEAAHAGEAASAIVLRHCERRSNAPQVRNISSTAPRSDTTAAHRARDSSVGVTMSGTMIVIAPAAWAAVTP